MTITREYIETKFEEFNKKMFGGRLPLIPIELSDAATFMGKCEYRRRRLPNGLEEYSDFKMRINTRYDLPEHEVEDVIIHEMIHYFILLNGLHDSSPHGEIFKALMRSINASYGRHITIRHESEEVAEVSDVSGRARWHVIAAVYFKSGETGVKVLPRTIPKILNYYRTAVRDPKVSEVRLFLHNNPFFNRYPTSGALRIHSIGREELERNLVKAHKLRVDGNRLIQE